MKIGPLEYMVVGFPGNKVTGHISPALSRLVDSGAIRVIDLALVSKDERGNVSAFEVEELDSDAAKAFRAIESVTGDIVSAADLELIGSSLPANTSAAVLVWEDAWAAEFVSALEEADGVLLDIQRVPRDVALAAMDAAGLTR